MDIALALGGGGARGNAHIGVLRALSREGFNIRAVAGTSFGGLVAVFFALGRSADEIELSFKQIDQSRLYGHTQGDGPSLLGLGGVTRWLDEQLGLLTFDDLKIPCAVTAVDLRTSREVILSEGLLREALLATIALPGIFPSRRIQDWDLVDGGTLDPVPVSVARTLMPKLPVVAVSLTASIGEPERTMEIAFPGVPNRIAQRIARLRPAQALDIFLQAVEIGSRLMTDLRLEKEAPDVVIRPLVQHIKLLDVVDVAALARIGEDAVTFALPALQRMRGLPARVKRTLAQWRALPAG